jgi:diadenosine tetraphosphate (Ap4A) HIT family hydrolase
MSPEDTWIITEFVVAVPHDHPLTPCHTVVAPRRHVAAFYDLDVQEQRMMWDVVGEIRKRVTSSLKVEGFDIGFADASPHDKEPVHAHIHVVPRTSGAPVDLPPGIEWVYLGSN